MAPLCPACGSDQSQLIYQVCSVPVHSVRLIWSHAEAANMPKGDIHLANCKQCGFIWNQSFQPELQDYFFEYESTQAFSSTYNAFAFDLAKKIIDRNQLTNKTILEIGCGQGEFLSLLCDIGNNTGVGFDPAYDPNRSVIAPGSSQVKIIRDLYSEKYIDVQADFVVCKMTLEHIPDVNNFLATVRLAISKNKHARVFFQVPNVDRIIEERAFWDIYYEHCSYFNARSLSSLFTRNNFSILDVWLDYGEQYLMIEAEPSGGSAQDRTGSDQCQSFDGTVLKEFTYQVHQLITEWKNFFQTSEQQNLKGMVWGSGSKAVAFLSALQLNHTVQYTVDINPRKTGSYLPGTGQQVVSPDFLIDYQPDKIILMNPLYRGEVTSLVHSMNVYPEIFSVGETI